MSRVLETAGEGTNEVKKGHQQIWRVKWKKKKKKGMRVTEKEQNKKVDHEANIKYILTENMDMTLSSKYL